MARAIEALRDKGEGEGEGGAAAAWDAAIGGSLGMCLFACVGCFGRSSAPLAKTTAMYGAAAATPATSGGYSYAPRIPQPRKPASAQCSVSHLTPLRLPLFNTALLIIGKKLRVCEEIINCDTVW